jgi:hypothetical protein
MLRRRLLLILLALALSVVAWLALSQRANPKEPGAASTQPASAEAAATTTAAANERREEAPRPHRARLRVLDRTGQPRAFGALTLRGPGDETLGEFEADSDGWLEFETPAEHASVWITGDLVFGEVAPLRTKDAELDYGSVWLRARAQLSVEVLGLPATARSVVVALRYPNAPGVTRDFGEELEVAVVAGGAHATLRAEALRPAYITLQGDGVRRAFHERELTLEPGSRETLVLDLRELCALHARVVGLPPEVLEGRSVEVSGVVDCSAPSANDSGAAQSTLGAALRTTRARTSIDATGRFSVGALERVAVRAELSAGDWRALLIPLEPRNEPLETCIEREQLLTPAEPLVAIGLFERDLTTPIRGGFALALGDAPIGLLQTPSSGWVLARRSELASRPPLRVFASGLGLATLAAPDQRVDSDGLLRLSRADFDNKHAPILVEFTESLTNGVELVVRGSTASGVSFASDPDFKLALGVERTERRVLVSRAPSGEYELLWRHRGQYRRAEQLAHDSSRTTRVVLRPQPLVELRGVVVDAPGEENATSAADVRSVLVEQRTFAVNAATFLYRGFDPPPQQVDALFATGLRAPAVGVLSEGGVFRVELARAAARRLQLAPLQGGRLVAEPWPYLERSPAPRTDVAYIATNAAGELLVPTTGPGARGRVWEFGDGFKLLRGWYDDGAKSDPSFEGRLVDFSLRRPRGPLALHALGPHDPLGAPLLQCSGAHTTQLWLPNAATALRLDFADGRVIDVEVLSTRVTLD